MRTPLYSIYNLPYILPSSVCPKPFAYTLLQKLPGVGGISSRSGTGQAALDTSHSLVYAEAK